MNISQVNQNSWNIPIDKLMVWRNGWAKYDRKISKLYLRVVYDQLFITADTKILESFNMHQKLKGIYKEDILILIASGSNYEIKSDVAQCLEVLNSHFPVVNHTIIQSNKGFIAKYRSIDEILHLAIEQKENAVGRLEQLELPKEHENFVKLCLLDPTFPLFVSETEKILNNLSVKK